jgi:alpha,alpha-trehalose-phosphate synthase [UDP-forming]
VSNRAPVEIRRSEEGFSVEPTVGGLGSALDDALRERQGIWVAWAGEDAPPELRPEATGLAYPIRTVHLTSREVDDFYGGFANRVLWPLCHVFPERCRFDAAYWPAYQDANARFASVVERQAGPGDLVWVNDFHLCLVPSLLRARDLGVRIGMFWHVPFPPPAVFRICPWRHDLLAGLLGADLIAFQTDEDVAHFAACVREVLGFAVTADRPRIGVGDRDVLLGALPVGVDAARLTAAAARPETLAAARTIRATAAVEKLILAVDRLDYTKGILERLLGFERFLETNPGWQGRVGLVQITAPSRFRIEEYRAMKQAIDETVGRIVGRFTVAGRSPLSYVYTAFRHEDLVPYYRAADVALVTPLRDGMNLVAKEYVATHADGDGTLVLSEFAGAARELGDAVLVNSWDPAAIARGIERALALDPEERRARMTSLAAAVATRDVRWWASAFLMLLAGQHGGRQAVAPARRAVPLRRATLPRVGPVAVRESD